MRRRERRIEELRFRMMVRELLTLLKERYKYRELARMTGIPATVLSRYVTGHVIPSPERAKELWSAITKLGITNILMDMVYVKDGGYIDDTHLISSSFARKFIATWALDQVLGKRVNAILAPEVRGAVLATSVSDTLGVPLIIARRTREGDEKDLYHATINRIYRMETFYVPKDMIRKNSYIVIFDDIIRTGSTIKAMINIAEQAKAHITMVLAAIGVQGWQDALKDIPTKVLLQIRPPS